MNTKLLRITILNGLWFGATLCLYSLLMWVTRLDTEYLYIGQYLDILVIVVPIFFIFRAIKQACLLAPITIGHRILIAVGVGLMGYILHAPYLYLYHNFINPTWFDAVIALEKQNLVAKNISSPEIQAKIQMMIDRNNAQNRIFHWGAFIASVLVVPLLISLLSLIFVRKAKTAA